MKKILKGIIYFFSPIIIILLLIVSYLAVDYEARRYVFIRIAPAYNLYQQMILKERVQERNYKDIASSLLSYIEKSKILADGKSKMLEGIVDVVAYATERATSEKELSMLEPVFRELITLDPNLYRARVWLARSLKNKNPEESLLHIVKAINISESAEEAYRELIKISHNRNLSNKNIVCRDYFSAQFGEVLPKAARSHFGGLGLSSFALEFANENGPITLYPSSGIKLNSEIKYEFIPLSPIRTDGFNLYLSTLPGLSITINKINVFANGLKNEIAASEFSITTKYGYITGEDNGKVSIISLPPNYGDEVIFINHNSFFDDLSKVELVMSFKRLPLTNKNFCN